jgi:competence CoiA-like predicted nuclease
MSVLQKICYKHFDTQNAYTVQKLTHKIKKKNKVNINDYIESDRLLVCKNKHKLYMVKSDKIQSHFRHKNPSDTRGIMTEWHLEWQSYFDNTEVLFEKQEYSISNRRADIVQDNIIIEIQHSNITEQEVNERKHDYELHGKTVYWIIDGNNTVETNLLNNDSGRIFLVFTSKLWKFQNFAEYEFIFIDINEQIYKICPNEVKSCMIDVQQPIPKNEFIESLKNNEDIFQNNNNIYQTQLFVKQQGAGNGKTYGIIQLLQTDGFEHYNTFVYLTKQHSAVNVIHQEIKDQQDRGELQFIEIINEDFKSKKHFIEFRNIKTNSICKIIIATFDSFIYALGDKECSGIDKFINMVSSIINEEYEIPVSNKGYIKYADGITFNKKLLLIGDEMQDLHEKYMIAVLKLTQDRYVDFYAVGDELQSISIKDNAFTYLKKYFPPDIINIHRTESTNICRRFYDPHLIDFVNHMIPFNNYNLLPIKQNNIQNIPKSLEIFHGKTIYVTDKNKNKITTEVDQLMYYYKYEVEENNRIMKDFLIVTPFVQKNPLVEELHLAIREYWKNRTNDEEYNKYSVFHKSEEGTSIDLSESNDLTRIVSIHSSKGDGRKVVFVIGITEGGLKRYSKDTDNLVYNSLLHVALTRMKEKLYIRVEANGDDIHRRIQLFQNMTGVLTIPPYLIINRNIKFKNIIYSTLQEENFKECYNEIIQFTEYKDIPELTENTQIIDLKHHNIRYATMYISFILNIIPTINNQDIEYQPIYQKLTKCNEYTLISCDTMKKYYKFLDKMRSNKVLPIHNIHTHYHNILKNIIINIKQNIRKYIKTRINIFDDSLECICLYHIMDIIENGKYTSFPISDLYDIIDIYTKQTSDEKEKYMIGHYDKITHINALYISLNDNFTNLKWLFDHPIPLSTNTAKFSINKSFNLIAYNTNTVIICYIKPQFNSMNYNDIMYETIFDTYLISNCDNNSEGTYNTDNFSNKKILCCILSLNSTTPYYFDWNISNTNIFTPMIKKNLISIYHDQHQYVYAFYKYWKNIHIDNEPYDIIDKIIDEYDKNIKKYSHIKYPEYICDYLKYIRDTVDDDENRINDFDDETYFMTKIDSNLKRIVNKCIK